MTDAEKLIKLLNKRLPEVKEIKAWKNPNIVSFSYKERRYKIQFYKNYKKEKIPMITPCKFGTYTDKFGRRNMSYEASPDEIFLNRTLRTITKEEAREKGEELARRAKKMPKKTLKLKEAVLNKATEEQKKLMEVIKRKLLTATNIEIIGGKVIKFIYWNKLYSAIYERSGRIFVSRPAGNYNKYSPNNGEMEAVEKILNIHSIEDVKQITRQLETKSKKMSKKKLKLKEWIENA